MVRSEGAAASVMLASGVVALALAVLVWSRRQGRTGAALAAVVLAVGGWDLAYGLELLSGDVDRELLWGDLKYVGICALAPSWLAFVLAYTGRGPVLGRRLALALAVEPLVVLSALAAPGTHDLVRHLPRGVPPGVRPVVTGGPLFWVHLVYVDAVLVGATAAFVWSLVRRSRAYWLQGAALAGAAVLPLAVNLLFNVVPSAGRYDATPVAFTGSCVVLTWGLFRQRLLRLTPVARSVLVDQMADGMLVLDAYGRVVDANPAVLEMLGTDARSLVGRPAAQALPAELLRGPADAQVWWRRFAGQEHAYEVRDTELTGSGGPAGRLLVLRDVSERVRLEGRLRELADDRARVADALSQSLRPAALPTVAGMRLAARYRPAGSGREIGGDFYDLSAVGDAWAFCMGDVSGKGARAAAATASARYTLRALAAEHTPAEALRRLNRVVAGEHGDETYLTVAHGRLRAVSSGVAVTLALGGHPQPLLVRRTGEVEVAGEPGSAMGLLPEVELTEVELLLRAGDCLFLFTDGVTEARSPDGFFGDEALAAALAACAGQGAEALAGHVLDLVLDLQGSDAADDIAVLVIEAR